MFGYIRLNRMEMKLKDINRYSAYYCALCDQLGRSYGLLSRFLLSYDVTFLLICLDSLVLNEKEQRKIRCPYNILQTKSVFISPAALCYSAFINYWLVVQKLEDDCRDDKAIWKFAVKKFLASRRKYKDMEAKFREQTDDLAKLLCYVYEKEQKMESEIDFDEATNAFGAFFAKLFQVRLPGAAARTDSELIQKLSFQMGKWIYIMDAYDDFQKDVRKKKINLLYAMNHGKPPEKTMVFEIVCALYLQIKHKIKHLLNTSNAQLQDDCIMNIVTYGIDKTFEQITRQKYKEFIERMRQIGTTGLEQLAANNQ